VVHDFVVKLGQAQLTAGSPLKDVPVSLRMDHSFDSELFLDLEDAMPVSDSAGD
jgi:hypothetical protein